MPEQDWISQKVKENGSQSSSNISKILETLLWNSLSNFELFLTDPKGLILVQRARLGRYVMTPFHRPAFLMTYDLFLQPNSALGCKADTLRCVCFDFWLRSWRDIWMLYISEISASQSRQWKNILFRALNTHWNFRGYQMYTFQNVYIFSFKYL